ncbi:MAG: VOC family protein [bacterium]
MAAVLLLQLDHIQICIPVGKEDEARKFYTDILKLNEIQKPSELLGNGGLWYDAAGIQLHLGTENISCKSKGHPAFLIKNITEAREYLAENMVEIQDEIQIPGIIRFSFFDPFGNRIELLQKTHQA